jgi:hypothetical protein
MWNEYYDSPEQEFWEGPTNPPRLLTGSVVSFLHNGRFQSALVIGGRPDFVTVKSQAGEFEVREDHLARCTECRERGSFEVRWYSDESGKPALEVVCRRHAKTKTGRLNYLDVVTKPRTRALKP